MAPGRKRLLVAAVALVVVAVAGIVVRDVRANRREDRLCSLLVTQRNDLLAHPFPGGPRSVFVLGDSYAQGAGLRDAGDPSQAWPALVAEQLPATVTVDAAGSTGFTTSGFCDGPWQAYGRRLAGDSVAADAAVVQGGINDALTGDPDGVQRSAAAVLENLADVGAVVVVGPVDAPAADHDRVAAVDSALRQATDAAHRTYVPLIAEQIELGPDRLHPTAAGQQRIAALVAAALG